MESEHTVCLFSYRLCLGQDVLLIQSADFFTSVTQEELHQKGLWTRLVAFLCHGCLDWFFCLSSGEEQKVSSCKMLMQQCFSQLLLFVDSEGLRPEADGSAESDSLFMNGSRWSPPLMCVYSLYWSQRPEDALMAERHDVRVSAQDKYNIYIYIYIILHLFTALKYLISHHVTAHFTKYHETLCRYSCYPEKLSISSGSTMRFHVHV